MVEFQLASIGAYVAPRAPCVVAFCESFEEPPELRAELRGVGAELVVMTPRAGYWIAPDSETRVLRPDASGKNCILVYDDRYRLRWRREFHAPLEATLLAAIRSVRNQGATRREVLAGSLILALAQACSLFRTHDVPAPEPEGAPFELIDVQLNVNGENRKLRIDPRATLLDALRETLALTGTKKGCDMGQCGACTVLIDGVRINSCLQLAVMNDGKHVTTIEGLSKGDDLHPMQKAFVDCDALQCGYCTPGQILSAIGMLKEGRPSTREEICEGMSGNLCRCGAYTNIFQAIEQVRG